MIDVINLFLSVFSGIAQLFSGISLGSFSFGSLIFGGFVVGLCVYWVLSVIRR